MESWRLGNRYQLHILETPEQLTQVEDLQRLVWPGNETEIVPSHILLAAIHNGGLAIGAYDVGEGNLTGAISLEKAPIIGFVFGFPGIYFTPDGPRPLHCSHMLGVHPSYRDQGIGFALKRAQWQMVRHQGLDRITWTYDPLLSRNAHLNITLLGAVCNTYLRDFYGEMRDALNIGIASDRFQVDWWINTQRVSHRLGKKPRPPLDLAHYLDAEVAILNPTKFGVDGLLRLTSDVDLSEIESQTGDENKVSMYLVEIPANFMDIKAADMALAQQWRMQTRELFEGLFQCGYLLTDFVFLPGKYARSYYVLSYGESTL